MEAILMIVSVVWFVLSSNELIRDSVIDYLQLRQRKLIFRAEKLVEEINSLKEDIQHLREAEEWLFLQIEEEFPCEENELSEDSEAPYYHLADLILENEEQIDEDEEDLIQGYKECLKGNQVIMGWRVLDNTDDLLLPMRGAISEIMLKGAVRKSFEDEQALVERLMGKMKWNQLLADINIQNELYPMPMDPNILAKWTEHNQPADATCDLLKPEGNVVPKSEAADHSVAWIQRLMSKPVSVKAPRDSSCS